MLGNHIKNKKERRNSAGMYDEIDPVSVSFIENARGICREPVDLISDLESENDIQKRKHGYWNRITVESEGLDSKLLIRKIKVGNAKEKTHDERNSISNYKTKNCENRLKVEKIKKSENRLKFEDKSKKMHDEKIYNDKVKKDIVDIRNNKLQNKIHNNLVTSSTGNALDDSAHILKSDKSIIEKKKIKISCASQDKHEEENEFIRNKPIDERKANICNFATIDIDIPYSKINSALFLPKHMKKIVRLYNIIQTIHDFNENRNISLVLVKYQESIEKLYRHRVETKDLEELNFFCSDSVIFKPITVTDNGRTIKTYAIKVAQKVEIEEKVYQYLMTQYKKWLSDNEIIGSSRRIHPDFRTDEIEIPRRCLEKDVVAMKDSSEAKPDLLGSDDFNGSSGSVKSDLYGSVTSNSIDLADAKVKSKTAALDIYERIRKKEEERKKAFLQETTVKRNGLKKMDEIFSVTKKRAIKLDDLSFQINGSSERKDEIIKLCNKKYFLKNINGCKYVVRRE